MGERETLRDRLKRLEARRPSIEDDPDGHRMVNEEMARITDHSRAYQAAEKPRSVV